MRYQMKQKLLSLGDKGVIYDGEGNPAYKSHGHFFNLKDRVELVDARTGAEVATLHSKLTEFPKSLHIEVGGKPRAKFRRKTFSLHNDYFIELSTGEKWSLRGTYAGYSFTLLDHNGGLVATVSRDWVALVDGYGVEIPDGYDPVFVLMLLVALETTDQEEQNDY